MSVASFCIRFFANLVVLACAALIGTFLGFAVLFGIIFLSYISRIDPAVVLVIVIILIFLAATFLVTADDVKAKEVKKNEL